MGVEGETESEREGEKRDRGGGGGGKRKVGRALEEQEKDRQRWEEWDWWGEGFLPSLAPEHCFPESPLKQPLWWQPPGPTCMLCYRESGSQSPESAVVPSDSLRCGSQTVFTASEFYHGVLCPGMRGRMVPP